VLQCVAVCCSVMQCVAVSQMSTRCSICDLKWPIEQTCENFETFQMSVRCFVPVCDKCSTDFGNIDYGNLLSAAVFPGEAAWGTYLHKVTYFCMAICIC